MQHLHLFCIRVWANPEVLIEILVGRPPAVLAQDGHSCVCFSDFSLVKKREGEECACFLCPCILLSEVFLSDELRPREDLRFCASFSFFGLHNFSWLRGSCQEPCTESPRHAPGARVVQKDAEKRQHCRVRNTWGVLRCAVASLHCCRTFDAGTAEDSEKSSICQSCLNIMISS